MQEDDRLKARRTFVERHRHLIGGFVMDAVAGNTAGQNGRTGFELSSWARDRFRQIDAGLGHMFDELVPPDPAPLVLTEAEKQKLASEKKGPVR